MAKVKKKKFKSKKKLLEFKLNNLKKGRLKRLRNLKLKKKLAKKELKYPVIKEVKKVKGRKGVQVYVKLEKGDSGRYFKKQKGLSKKDYIEAKKSGIIDKKKGVKKVKIKEGFLKKLSTKKKIEDILLKGYAETKLRSVSGLSPYEIKRRYFNLLTNEGKGGDGKPVVRDKELINILSEEQNVNKYRHRLAYEIILYGQKDEILAKLTYIQAKKNLREVVNDINENLKVGMDVKGWSNSIKNVMNPKGYTSYIENHEGRIKDIKLKMVFRKA